MLHRTSYIFILLVCFSLDLLNINLVNTVNAEQPTTGKITGKVSNTNNASGYTYIEVDTGKEKVWAAGPVTPVAIGDPVAFTTEMPMENFHSKSMQRDFDVIYFVNSFTTDNESVAGRARPGTSTNTQMNQELAVKKIEGINKAEDGNTIAEIYSDKANLKGKTIRVRGQVSKYNPGIMGKNWIHIKDSSSTDDLTVTTDGTATLNDVVVIEGVLALDKDFGGGYVYPLIVEEASIKKD